MAHELIPALTQLVDDGHASSAIGAKLNRSNTWVLRHIDDCGPGYKAKLTSNGKASQMRARIYQDHWGRRWGVPGSF